MVIEEDHIHSLLNGVDKDYNLVHATISSKIDLVTQRKVCSMLVTHEKSLEKHNASNIDSLLPSANLVSNQSKQFSNEVASERSFNDNNHQYASGRGQNFNQRSKGRGNFDGNCH